MGRKHKTTVTFLSMDAEPDNHVPVPARKMALMRCMKPPLHFYRYLYDGIGRDHIWVDRKRKSDEELAAIIHDDLTEIYVLYVDGAPAGFAELNFREPGICELVYLGLTPDSVGGGLGEYLLAQAIDIAWQHPITKMKVQTCTLDHPRALGLYQRLGFVPYAQTETEVEDID
ncbi:GNAT family N-acetyltransferase [Pyruvatibacter mobilis]|uniref:GNAT family N-acetyltransferase n=1 Tax=Pyruvatibacter mobilis TaxID=1712261 RepID=UPI003BA955C1